jgi:hypothetical protein
LQETTITPEDLVDLETKKVKTEEKLQDESWNFYSVSFGILLAAIGQIYLEGYFVKK